MKVFWNGLSTGLVLQLAIGPVFFFIINLALQRTVFDGLAGALAVGVVDYFYVMLGIMGISKFLESNRIKKNFGIGSSIILTVFGVVIINGALSAGTSAAIATAPAGLLSSFISVLLLTLSNPLTIVIYTSLVTAKAIECGYAKKELFIFGAGIGLATFTFMSVSVLVFATLKETIPPALIQALNLVVGCLLVLYGGRRFIKVLRHPRVTKK